MNLSIEDIKKSINKRVGKFLYMERKLAGKTLDEVATKFQIDELVIARWEAGLSSPPGFQYASIIQYYGQGAWQRAEKLDCEFQMERYQRGIPQSKSFKPLNLSCLGQEPFLNNGLKLSVES